jgi:cyclopropane-fatty-acyl-phospholipid synthase
LEAILFVQNQLKSWIAGIRSKTALPLRIELWNGQHVDLSSEAPRHHPPADRRLGRYTC